MADEERLTTGENLDEDTMDDISGGGFGFKTAMRYDCYLNGERIRHFFNREQAESFTR